MSDFRPYNPATDPARSGKSGWINGLNPAYPATVQRFNTALYTPMDRKPDAPAAPAWTQGWQGPRAPVPSGQYQTPYGTASVRSNAQYQTAMEAAFGSGGAPTFGGIPSMAATAAPFGPPAPTFGGAPGLNPGPPIGSQNVTMPASTGQLPQATNPGAPPVSEPPGPAQNAMQRWTGNGGSALRPLTPQTRFFWATNHIDARAPQADQSQNAGAVQPVDFRSDAANPQQSQVGTGAPVTFNNNVAGHSDWVSGL